VGEDDIDLKQLSSFVSRHRRLFATCLFTAIVLSTCVALLWPRTYTASASFIPQGRNQVSSLASLASQFGISVPLSDASRSPGFYAALLQSKNVLANVVERRYQLPAADGGASASLVDYLRGRGANADLRRQSAIEKLVRRLSVSVDQKAGLVRFEIQLRDPLVSRDVARAFIAEVDSFNLKSRQTQASSERRFSEGRLAEARAEARQADDELQAFLQRNRDFRTSPQLNFAYERLVNNVSLRQQIYTSVAQAYEQARIEEVRDTPVITVVEAPMVPARSDPPPYARSIVAGVLLALVAARILGAREDRRVATGA
jgi:uncharacterized protein involved in exopolysaccharide biosynthesis